MKGPLTDIYLIRDIHTLGSVSEDLSRQNGGVLICTKCGDIEALIAGILVIEENEEAWPLCGDCLRLLPMAGATV